MTLQSRTQPSVRAEDYGIRPVLKRKTPKPKRISDYSRARDDVILDWVRRRAAGQSCHRIAQIYGVSRGQVVAATTRVMDADKAHSGQEAEGYYW